MVMSREGPETHMVRREDGHVMRKARDSYGEERGWSCFEKGLRLIWRKSKEEREARKNMDEAD